MEAPGLREGVRTERDDAAAFDPQIVELAPLLELGHGKPSAPYPFTCGYLSFMDGDQLIGGNVFQGLLEAVWPEDLYIHFLDGT
jgi:hypothetical protein